MDQARGDLIDAALTDHSVMIVNAKRAERSSLTDLAQVLSDSPVK